ncbi:elongin-A isoform X1 [Alosa sapidissima]|uniref:elongin-A isoform X1 n=2 Tax=Alosa sapidissima TaxID=34773 RepID=UPI001C0A049D|nr:elongin-A isoform X1 [Alosa sapidissima]
MKQFPGPSVPLVNMAEELLETVERLQSRLSENQEPRKLLKTLKRLAELPMTVDILVETGVGKTVNSLRKHDLVGEAAKSIVAKWKKLVPQSADRPTPTKDDHAHSLAADFNRGHKRVREPSPEELRHVEEEEEEEEEEREEEREEEYEHHGQEEEEEEEEEEQEPMNRYQHGYSPSPPQAYSPTAPSLTGQRLPQYQQAYDSPQEEPAPSPPRKEPRHSKPHRDPARDHRDRPRDRHSASGGPEQERRKRPPQPPAGSGGVEGKRSSDREQSSSSSSTHRSDKHKNTHTSHDRKHTPHDGRKEKKGGSEGRAHSKRDETEPQEEEREEFETPTMSFESFLTYDAPTPTKKKKKLLKPSPKPAAAAPPPTPPSKASATNGARSSKRSERAPSPTSTPVTPTPEKRRKVVDVMPTLPDIPLPAIQPNYRPLPSIEHTPVSPQRRKVPVSCDEEDAGFTGRRFNSKMVVYSGSKTAYLPKMMSLYEQCIRVLQNNIDSIDEVGGVPFEILEPVMERCTPEQLYRIEECNQHFLEDTDELWMKHCQRDFKRQSPLEYESWRELYLRLHDEREERLRKLTQNISSAHANRPKGRQVKMAYVNSVAKPPRDVRRRQEKFGTNSGASSSASSASSNPVRIKPAMAYTSQSDDGGHSSYSSPPETSRPSMSGGGGPSARDKPQVKKIAPMMAKTIKAFKNRFSRR